MALRGHARDIRLVVIALAAGSLIGAAPASAACDATNAYKVDGFRAVGAKATVAQRKGKLVATNPKTGRLPNNIIRKAPNANQLDGIDATGFVQNQVLSGEFICSGTTFVAQSPNSTHWINAELYSDDNAIVRCNATFPARAKITGVTFEFKDSNPFGGIPCKLVGTNLAPNYIGGQDTIGSASSGGPSNQISPFAVSASSLSFTAVEPSFSYYFERTLGQFQSNGIYGAIASYDYDPSGATVQ